MKTILRIVTALAVVLFASVVFAQNSVVFLGASYTHNGDLPRTIKGVPGFLHSGTDIAGGDLGFSAKLKGPFGLAFDGNFSHSTTQNQFLFAGGPELRFGKKNQLFAHALVGGAYQTQKLKGFQLTSLADSSFAYELGGGLDHFFGKHFGVRAGVDYIYTDAFHSSEQNVRAIAGFVIR